MPRNNKFHKTICQMNEVEDLKLKFDLIQYISANVQDTFKQIT